MSVSSNPSAVWYIVLHPVVLKDKRNHPILNLAPGHMIIVEKLWQLDLNEVIAQVLYPARGYVPYESRSRGKLVTRLDLGGMEVPKEILEINLQQTNQETTVFENQSQCLHFNHWANRLPFVDHQAPLQEIMPNLALEMIPSSYLNALSGNKCLYVPLLSLQNRNQRTQFRSYLACNYPVESSTALLEVNRYPELMAGTFRNQYTINPSLFSVQSMNSEFDNLYPFARANGKLSSLPSIYFIRNEHNSKENNDGIKCRVHQQQRLRNSSSEDIEDLVNSCANTNSFVEQSWEKDESRRLEKEQINSGSIVLISPSNIKLGKKSDVVVLCKSRNQWRHDPDRWITVSALCHSLHIICQMNTRKSKAKNLKPIMIFHSPSVPNISLSTYLHRIAWFLPCPKACFVLALEYIFRLAHHCPEVCVNDYSVHQIVITSIMIAAKFIDDKIFKNPFYARLAGIPVINISGLEVQFVFFLKFDLHVFPEQYNARYKAMLADNKGPNMVVIRQEGNAI